MTRAPCCEKVGLKKGRWTQEEDEILINYIRVHGEGSWRSLPKNAGLLRCGKSCRLRWINYLREDLKRGSLSKEEEDVIIKLHATLGNRWSLIAGHLPGRTDNEIKNYWNSHLSRRIDTFLRFRDIGSSISSTTVDPIKVAEFSKRKGGRANRSTAKNKKPDTHIATSINASIVADEVQSMSKKFQTISNSPSTNSIVTMDQELCNIGSELFTWLDNMVNNEGEDQSLEQLGKNGRRVDYELEGMEAKLWEDMLGFENQDGELNFPPLEPLEPLDDWLFPDFN